MKGEILRPTPSSAGCGAQDDKSVTLFAEVAPLGLACQSLSYRIPQTLAERVVPGVRVTVPFRNSSHTAIVTALTSEPPPVSEVKEIVGCLDESPILSGDLLALGAWIARRSLCAPGVAYEAMLPAALRRTRPRRPRVSTWTPAQAYEESYAHPSELTSAQSKALKEIERALRDGLHRNFLVHGITASGKTELYLRAIEIALELGRQAILLVPEIALTPQLAARFRSRFQDKAVVFHSNLPDGARAKAWEAVRKGEFPVVIGARSAIFAPFKNLGLVIVDEEHESGFKQEDAPRYHAIEAARERCRLNNAVLVLGSATPSLESYQRARASHDELLVLPERIHSAGLPKVEVVDLREVKKVKGSQIFSGRLMTALSETVAVGRQAILFLNRRGFAGSLLCARCGQAVGCQACSVSLVVHAESGKLRCHYCDFECARPPACPACASPVLIPLGLGTQRVEFELKKLLPQARVARLDSDTTKRRGVLDHTLDQFKKGELDILVGTQMVAKGLDFPKVTLVGVVLADLTLQLPDFRSSERTFSLLTQVAGRSGRGEDAGRVLVQTYLPDHYAIRSGVAQDYGMFYEKELEFRKALYYPPFSELVRILLRGKNEERVEKAAVDLAARIRSSTFKGKTEILGPAPAYPARMHGQFRRQILLKLEGLEQNLQTIRNFLSGFKKPSSVALAVDLDR